MVRPARFVRVSTTFAVLTAVAAMAACGGSNYRYVSNRDAGAFFKVPDEWDLYDEADVLRAEDDEATREELEAASDSQWFRGFDSADDPELANVYDLDAGEPRGFAVVRDLTAQERDVVNLSALRQIGFPVPDPATGQRVDPLAFFLENRDGFVEVLEYDDDNTLGELSLAEGHRGIRLRTRVELPDREPVIFEQVTVVDADTTRLYRFTVGCAEDCWDDNEDVIREIADSWTLEEAS